MKKYRFTGKTKNHEGRILKQIQRISDGLIGGWIESESNLSHEGSCWVYGNARVSGNAEVYGDAEVSGNARVSGYDELTGAISQILNVSKFNVFYSKTDKYIRVGCKSHTFAQWHQYVKSKSKAYLKDCGDTKSHKECVKLIKFILKQNL